MNLQVGVKVLIKNQHGAYLFLRRNPDKYRDMAPQWDIPGGRIDPTEPISDALRREVFEEVGMQIADVPVLLAAQDIFVPHKELHVVRLTYVATATGDVKLSDEHHESIWLTRDEVLADDSLDEYVRQVLEGSGDYAKI